MVRAQVERRVEVLRCFNCLGYNHKASECTEERRNKSCYRCGGEDHMAKDCKSTEEFCVVCRSAGHRAGSGKCRLFKQALAAAKKEHKSRGGQKISRCQTCKVDGHKEETMACPKHKDALRDKTEKRKRISSERMEEESNPTSS
nr:PREDICTED: cellular nucleic acid-binding protein homolog [Tribolium castaneum]|eukprot:XP_015840229.1 PREDICTED: cellular nucleic acid-binding protein homolog [Tribolium castaneum]